VGNKLPVIFFLLVAALGYQIIMKRAASAGALDYYTSWDDAAKEAKSAGKPIMLVFGGPW